MKFSEAFLLVLLQETVNIDSINSLSDFTKILSQSKINVDNVIAKNGKLNHDEKSLILMMKKASRTFLKKYFEKERTHQNTSVEKENFLKMSKAVFEYNNSLNNYNDLHTEDPVPTFGDVFRSLGGKTNNKSVETEK